VTNCGLRRGRGDQQRGQVLLTQAGAHHLAETLLERDGQQEREQDLYAGLRHAQFLQQFVVVAVGAFDRCLVAQRTVVVSSHAPFLPQPSHWHSPAPPPRQ
jgi:hypothetical protein